MKNPIMLLFLRLCKVHPINHWKSFYCAKRCSSRLELAVLHWSQLFFFTQRNYATRLCGILVSNITCKPAAAFSKEGYSIQLFRICITCRRRNYIVKTPSKWNSINKNRNSQKHFICPVPLGYVYRNITKLNIHQF